MKLLYFLILSFVVLGASEIPEKGNKKLIIVTGSDWCVNCKRLEKKVLSDSAFTHFLNVNNIELMIVDFPQRTQLPDSIVKWNNEITEKIGFDGSFPGVYISDKDSLNKYRKIEFSNENANEFISEMKRFL